MSAGPRTFHLKHATIEIAETPQELAQHAARIFFERARAALHSEKGRFAVALAGGSTPRKTYETIAARGRSAPLPWERLFFFWGDERNVPPDHPESNHRMARETILDALPIPSENIHRVRTELGEPSRIAADYEADLRRFFRLDSPEATPRFDLVFLGLGPDGHTASLFPAVDLAEEEGRLAAAPWVPRLGQHRITLTARVFNRAACIVFLVSGEGKAGIVHEVLEGKDGRYPVQIIRPEAGSLVWLLDHAAASALSLADRRP